MSDDGQCESGPDQNEVPKVRLTDKGLETPEHLVGATGKIRVELPEIAMEFTYVGDGVPEYSELVTFPPTDKEPINVPEGHAKIQGKLYEVVDDREISECPHCGSDKLAVIDDPVKCYDCADDPVEVDL